MRRLGTEGGGRVKTHEAVRERTRPHEAVRERVGPGKGGWARGSSRSGCSCRRHPSDAPSAEPDEPIDSTRFLRPARARSMMTFSALRLIMPSMGILTSTVRR